MLKWLRDQPSEDPSTAQYWGLCFCALFKLYFIVLLYALRGGMTYRPEFKCNFCGQSKAADVFGSEGLFVPCQCAGARAHQERSHYEEMERRKRARTEANVKRRGKR